MTLTDLIDVVQKIGFPAAVAAFVLIRLDRRLSELIAAMRDVADPDKTQMRFAKALDAQSAHIITHVGHDTRGAVQAGTAIIMARLHGDSAL